MLIKKEELKNMDNSDLSSYLGGLEIRKTEVASELGKVTTKHNKITRAISEVKAELMIRNSRKGGNVNRQEERKCL